jgi:hypothetical protein
LEKKKLLVLAFEFKILKIRPKILLRVSISISLFLKSLKILTQLWFILPVLPHPQHSIDLYSSPSIIRITKSRRMRWMGNVARMGEKRNAYRLLVGKRPLGRPRHRWVDNIRVDLGEVGWGDVDWIGLAQDRNRWRALVNSVLNLRVP